MTSDEERKKSLMEQSLKTDNEIDALDTELGALNNEKMKSNSIVEKMIEQAVTTMVIDDDNTTDVATNSYADVGSNNAKDELGIGVGDQDWDEYDRVHGPGDHSL